MWRTNVGCMLVLRIVCPHWIYRYIHKGRWGMQDVMSNSYLLSSSPVGAVCSDPALFLHISYSALFPSYTQILYWVNNDFTNTTRLGSAPFYVCVPTWMVSNPEVCQDCQRLLPLLCHSDGCKSSHQMFRIQ